jgi:hypothetical protein
MDVRYTNNEAYFDLIEEIDAIIDRNGVTVMCEIQGYVSEYDQWLLHNDEKLFLLKIIF